MNEPAAPLSERGEKRRREILDLALRAAAAKRRKRLVVRAAGIACLTVIAAAVGFNVWRTLRPSPTIVRTTPPAALAMPTGPMATRSAVREIVVQRIETDHTLVDRLAVRPATADIGRMSDDQLLARLEEAGKPAGLVRINERTVVVPH